MARNNYKKSQKTNDKQEENVSNITAWKKCSRWKGGSGWGTHVNPWLIHVNVWQKPLQYCKVISLQLIKINGKKKKKYSRQCSQSAHTGRW